ncbi:MAG: hypothetical protein R2939_13105 [Kofleriaceae bacterium]
MPDPGTEPVPYLTPKERHLEKKEVSGDVFTRLALAADAIAATKRAIQFQGNQVPALQATQMNSYYRLQVMRNPSCWEMTPEAQALAWQNPEAEIAAKADIAHGGNCGEHAWVAYHYLRQHGSGQHIQVAAKSGFDHAFVLIGDLKKDTDEEIAVSDPWVNQPIACLWEHHFAFTSDRSKIEDYASMVADGVSKKEAIKAGLRLSAYGKQLVEKKDSEEQTEEKTDKWKENHFWDHDEPRTEKFEYVPTKAP